MAKALKLKRFCLIIGLSKAEAGSGWGVKSHEAARSGWWSDVVNHNPILPVSTERNEGKDIFKQNKNRSEELLKRV